MGAISGFRRVAIIVLTLFVAACASLSEAVKPPSVSLSDLSVRDVGVFEQRYGLTLRVQNPNPEPLPITGLAYRVLVNDAELGRGVSRKSVTVPAYGEALVDVDLVSNAWQLVQRIRGVDVERTKVFKIAIAGDVSLANRSGQIPFTFQGEIGNPLSTP